MKKFLSLLDDNILRFSIAFAILFIPLYPKVPSIGISHVWVYIRLEDFLILLVSLIWIIQILRRKVTLPRPEGWALVAYWIAGLASLVYCLLFVAPHLQNFFPLIATLEYFRRIEYMILFFAAFSSIKKKSDIKFYLITLSITVACITIYGFGQRFYQVLYYEFFPAFFKQHPFCFPAFLTGNEEFAKGTPMCLDSTSRITSTFGGQYDLAAYVVFTLPILIVLFIVIKRWSVKVLLALLVFFTLELLNFTSSRTSFGAYIIGIVTMLIVWKKKWWLIPVLFVSVGSLFVISNSTLARYEKTIQPVTEVQIQPGVNPDLLQQISRTQETVSNLHPQSPQPGTLTLNNQTGLTSGNSTVLTQAEMQSLTSQNLNISSDSGAFLLSKAYALDISFTTRFQAEWPRDWQAFLGSPVFGTGYSSLTLASDNDYLRALGETGIVGTVAFLMIFVVFGIYMRKVGSLIKDPLTNAFLFGLVGGTIGLLINASLIDIFESSKVAESYWILLGLGLGTAKLYQTEKITYKKEILGFFSSPAMVIFYLLVVIFMTFGNSIGNYFVADDFTWLHWAAIAKPDDLLNYFIQSNDFFYRPLDKIIMYFFYMVFSLQPQGYHIISLLLHLLVASGVYFLGKKLTGNKIVGILASLLFVLHPSHTENIFWFSTLSDDLSSAAIIYMMLAFITFREKKSIIAYIFTIIFSAVAFASYEGAIVVPFVLLALDVFILKPKRNSKSYLSYLPFVLLFILYLVLRFISHSHFSGGDYTYHVSRILPNVVGNFSGYIGVFLAGLPFLMFYNFVRAGLRSEWIYFTVVAVLLLGYLGWAYSRYRTKITKAIQNKEMQVIIFCLVFSFIALLPYLPL